MRECSQEKPVREQGKQDRPGDKASKEVVPEVSPQPDAKSSSGHALYHPGGPTQTGVGNYTFPGIILHMHWLEVGDVEGRGDRQGSFPADAVKP